MQPRNQDKTTDNTNQEILRDNTNKEILLARSSVHQDQSTKQRPLLRTNRKTLYILSQKAEKRCPFAIFAPYLNLRLVAIKRGAKTMNRGRQQLSLAVCDAPPPLHADRGPHAFFSSCVCSSSNCGLAYAAAASTCTWQRREKYVVARAVALWRE